MKDRCLILEALINDYIKRNEVSKLAIDLKRGHDRQLIEVYLVVQNLCFSNRCTSQLKNQY